MLRPHISVEDGKGNATAFTYDHMDRLTKVTNALNEVTRYSYDSIGNKLTQTDGENHTTTYEYNYQNLPIRRIDHGGRSGNPGAYTYASDKVIDYTYDAEGKCLTMTDRNNDTTAYSYDVLGRLTEEASEDGTHRFTYDGNGNQLTIYDSENGTITSTYDELNRLVTETDTNGNSSTRRYNITSGVGAGQVAEEITDIKGNVTRNTYDKAGRLYSVTAEGSTTTFAYDANGNLSGTNNPAKGSETYTYDRNNRYTKVVNKDSQGILINSYDYTYDYAGNQLTKVSQEGTTRYGYDALNRLASVIIPNGKITTYTYDKAGNRDHEYSELNQVGSTTTHSYNIQNRLLEKDTVSDSGTHDEILFTYDKNGNLTEETTKQNGTVTTQKTFSYDGFNQMVQAVTPEVTADYSYNGLGLRISKTVDGAETNYAYEGTKVVLETDVLGNQTARNIYGNSRIIGRKNDDGMQFIFKNGHGDTTAVVDSNRNLVGEYTYEAFGKILTATAMTQAAATMTAPAPAIMEGPMMLMAPEVQTREALVTSDSALRIDLKESVTSPPALTMALEAPVLQEEKAQIAVIPEVGITESLEDLEIGVDEVIDTKNMDELIERLRKLAILNGTEQSYRIREAEMSPETLAPMLSESRLETTPAAFSFDLQMDSREPSVEMLPETIMMSMATATVAEDLLNILYAGYQYDHETGLYYLNARMYNPDTARFMQEDTYLGESGDPLSLNLYTYVSNNPVTYYDPSGHTGIGIQLVEAYGDKLGDLAATAAAAAATYSGYNWLKNKIQSTEPQNHFPDTDGVGDSIYNVEQYIDTKEGDENLHDNGSTVDPLPAEEPTGPTVFPNDEEELVEPYIFVTDVEPTEPIIDEIPERDFDNSYIHEQPDVGEYYYGNPLYSGTNSSGLQNQGLVNGSVEGAPSVDAGKQGKHVPGHNNNVSGKSQWPQGETGIEVTQEGWVNGDVLPDGTKVWDSGRVVGPNGETGVRVHIDGKGNIHGYPVNPSQYLK